MKTVRQLTVSLMQITCPLSYRSVTYALHVAHNNKFIRVKFFNRVNG